MARRLNGVQMVPPYEGVQVSCDQFVYSPQSLVTRRPQLSFGCHPRQQESIWEIMTPMVPFILLRLEVAHTHLVVIPRPSLDKSWTLLARFIYDIYDLMPFPSQACLVFSHLETFIYYPGRDLPPERA